MKLFHGTSDAILGKIAKKGLKGRTSLTDSEELAEYYAEEAVAELGGSEIILSVEVDENNLRVDWPAYDEPLTFYRDEYACDDEEWHEMIEEGEIPYPNNDKDWATALEATWSVKHEGAIPASSISMEGAPISDTVKACIATIKKVLGGDTVIDVLYEWGEGRLDRDPVLQPDKPKTDNDARYPQFFREDNMSHEPSDKDPIEEF